ncbi:LANO_0C01024g1_1 [Lachancea nothofagi CBS 11611]|uniref:Phosphodiesterase n=1 Tax=Lachancea nothofagi CBS 11611 TaxID=1266666 RepID=A0A1G4J4C4_9SACH|nr:LANO_0C01024g1_1 [Lachancea nothofagi CBS 11611]
MSMLFAVNSPELSTKLVSQFPDSNVVHVPCVADLLLRLYANRLSGSNTYERNLSLVVYQEPASTSSATPESALNSISAEELSCLIQKQFPCFSLSVTTPANALEAVGGLNTRRTMYSTRLNRVSTWMYNDYAGPDQPGVNDSETCAHSKSDHKSHPASSCSSNVYTMLSHLTKVRRSSACNQRKPYSKMISSALDLRSLIHVPRGNTDKYYWDFLSTWDFCAMRLNTSELVWCSYLILGKLARDAGFEVSDNELFLLLLTLEASYHQGNKFHNFRHAVDVMQATWQLCCRLNSHFDSNASVLLVCVAAIGHDVGHPGTNNALMCDPLSPIAKLYQKKSVLENFHTEIFSDILRDHWPRILEKQSVISDTILATDMALHSQYVDQMDTSSSKHPTLLSLIIKAADISNVTRPLHISTKWAVLITCEFNECAALLKFLQKDDGYENYMPECDDPLPDCVESMLIKYPSIPKGQLLFINAFAESLFAGLGDCFHELKFLHNNVQENKKFWEGKM